MLDEGICSCYVSRAYVDGKEVRVDVESSKCLKRRAVFRGFITRKGTLRKNLTAWEQLVILMREATSAEGFNHEWWAAEISKPEWVKNLDTLFRGGWLYYPRGENDLQPKRLGDRIGYQLALQERKLSRGSSEPGYVTRVEEAELRKAQRGLDVEDAKKVRIAFTGYENWKQFVEENCLTIPTLRQVALLIGGGEPMTDSAEFLDGVTLGNRRAAQIDLDNELSDDNEREEVAEILSDSWDQIDEMKTRQAVTDFVLTRLPETRRRFLEKSRADDKHQYKRFVERLRQTFYEQIGLRPRGRGRPENREKDS